ncbi:DUF5666 domain-containing protein [Roseomonas sp. BN140053]|uniref:DUF5666 domain-containing protein n=1 Tax=Roseomonas sp. BN140053 TaxID=3391898 RepID=UPI0039ED4025
MSLFSRLLPAAGALLAFGGIALAQAPGNAPPANAPAAGAPSSNAPAASAPTRMRGTIAALEGNTLTVATREGPRVPVMLNEPLTVSALRRMTLEEITPGAYVGVVGEPAADGTLRAVAVQVFPEALRGTAEGQFAWDLAPNTNMTNATVTASVANTSGREMTVNFRGQTAQIQVPPGTPILTPIPAARSDLVVGAPVMLSATRNAEGQLGTARVTVGKDGVAPAN